MLVEGKHQQKILNQNVFTKETQRTKRKEDVKMKAMIHIKLTSSTGKVNWLIISRHVSKKNTIRWQASTWRVSPIENWANSNMPHYRLEEEIC